MQTMRFCSLLFLSLFLYGCQTGSSPIGFAPRFVLSGNPPVEVDSMRTPFTFGYLEVLENRLLPAGRTIQLPVYIFKSRNPNPAPDPVLYTVGGPGSSSLGAAPYMRAFQYLDDRDLILFEQRGTTHARPNLACPEWAEVSARIARRSLSPVERNAEYVKAATGCRERLKAQNIELDAYNTREIVADIEDLRQTLNIDQLNLLTISYSTKIAQTMMRDYPKSLRSVVMDSPLPLAVDYEESSVSNLVEFYDTIFEDCATNPNCADKYPDLRQRFLAYLTRINAQPLELQVDNANDEGQTTVRLTGTDVVNYLGELNMWSVGGFLARLDGLIEGNNELLKDEFSWPVAGPGNGRGMRLSVWCSEELTFTDPEMVDRERTRFPFLPDANPMVFSYEVCRAWGVSPAPAVENQPVKSNIPTLLISGTYDPATPAKWAAELNRQLGNSHHLIFPGWTHTPTTYWDNPCAMAAANAFFNAPGQAPSLDCLQELKRPVFE